jgi:uncharacterized lipoprotein YddW (UPF0748 family)
LNGYYCDGCDSNSSYPFLIHSASFIFAFCFPLKTFQKTYTVRLLSYIFILLLLLQYAFATAAPKRELRAVWIATVGNIDWPSRQGLTAQQQQQEFISKLNFLQRHGFNAVIVQVRPAADALYDSPYEPWSRYLSGKQGQPPFPKYDPLEFMLQEAHKRNMELHAWFNPFRALVSSKSNPNPAGHITRTHPHWLIHYDNKSYFDPGNPEAREYILKIILDVVKRYDIDAVHIDDYFYPYPAGGREFPDGSSFARFNNGLSRGDWRRNNVNLFISQLNNSIKNEKPWVKFGVSPFGIWRNNTQDPEGSATRGSSCYDDLYSDIRLWLKNKWVDYVAPQLYWEHGHRLAAFDVLLPWWKDNSYGRNLFIGLGLYRMVGAASGVWTRPDEILKQIRATRSIGCEGVVLYSMSNFDKISSSLADSLRSTNYFGHIAIPPAMPWLKRVQLTPPVAKLIPSSEGSLIQWSNTHAVGPHTRYLVYRFLPHEDIDLNKSDHIIALTQANKFFDVLANRFPGARYVVTSVDRLWNESAPSNTVSYVEQ